MSWAPPGVGTVHDRVGGPWSRHQFMGAHPEIRRRPHGPAVCLAEGSRCSPTSKRTRERCKPLPFGVGRFATFMCAGAACRLPTVAFFATLFHRIQTQTSGVEV